MSLSEHVDHGRTRLRDAGQTLASKVTQVLPTSRKKETGTQKPYPSLSPPLVTLYVSPSESRQSEEAFELLTGSRTAFRVEESSNGTISARFAGKVQHGLEGITKLSDGLLSFERILLDASEDEDHAAELDRRYDPELKERTERELQDYLDAARADLHRILAGADTDPHST